MYRPELDLTGLYCLRSAALCWMRITWINAPTLALLNGGSSVYTATIFPCRQISIPGAGKLSALQSSNMVIV
jgi:hypothetical protein